MKNENKQKETIKTVDAVEIDPLFGLFNGHKSKYKQKTEKEYDTYIKSLTSFELDRHAASVGILPSPRASKTILFERLRRKFASESLNFPLQKAENSEVTTLSEQDEAELDQFFRRK